MKKKDLNRLASVLLHRYGSFIRMLAYRYSAKLPSSMDMEDLISLGRIGLLEAALRYKKSFGVPFRRFVEFRIRGSMLDEIRRQDFISRSLRQKYKKVLKELSNVERQHGEKPSDEALSLSTNISLKELQSLRLGFRFYSLSQAEETSAALEAKVAEEGASPSLSPYEFASSRNLHDLLLKALQCMTKREQKLIQMYYFEGKGLKEIGKHLDLSESRISQLRNKGLQRLRALLSTQIHEHELEELLAA